MATPPGSAGYTVVGDKSVEFYRDANAFIERRIEQHGSSIFLTRLLNKPTVCVGTNQGVRQVLCDQSHHVEMGYKSLMHQVYGENILFYEADDAQDLRTVLHKLFSPESVNTFQPTIDRLTSAAIDKLQNENPDCIYDFFKKLCTEICLTVFLDIDFVTSAKLAEDIIALTTLHWHGIISVPMALKLPMMQTSGFGKALEAKERLLEIIEDKLSNGCTGFPRKVSEAKFPSQSTAKGSLLLFTSALIPKALASILTSFVLALANDALLCTRLKSVSCDHNYTIRFRDVDKIPQHGTSSESLQDTTRYNDEVLRAVLLEVQRLWPPFVGGRRLVRKDCTVEGYHIPSGHAIVYLTRQAQRDPEVFDDPNSFRPDRWQNKNKYDTDKLFLYGAGPRGCIGREIVDRILKAITSKLLQNYSWNSPAASPGCKTKAKQYKWLPVSRPQYGPRIEFTHLGAETAL